MLEHVDDDRAFVLELARILTARWLGLAPREGRLFVLEPAGVGVLGSEHDRPAVTRWGV